MNNKRILITLIYLCITFFTTDGQKKIHDKPYFIIQVTDPQFGMFEGNKGFALETALYEKAVRSINRLDPDFVVITGDLVNRQGDREQIAEFKRISSLIKKGIPVWYLPGNHDIGQTPAQSDIVSFIADYGHDRFSLKHKKSRFIGINSSLIKSENQVAEELQLNWLKGELAKSKSSNHLIVFCHYPFFIKSPEEAETYSNIPLAKREKYLSLFSEYGTDAIYAGHLHNNSAGKYMETDMITTSAVGKPLSDAPSGLRVIKIYPDRIESTYYGLDEIPEIITFAP